MRGSNVVCGVVNPKIWLKTFIKIYLHVRPQPQKWKKYSHSDPPLLSQNPGSTRGGLFTYLKNRICRFSNEDLITWLTKKSVIEYILRQNPRDTESAEKYVKIDEFNQISKSCS